MKELLPWRRATKRFLPHRGCRSHRSFCTSAAFPEQHRQSLYKQEPWHTVYAERQRIEQLTTSLRHRPRTTRAFTSRATSHDPSAPSHDHSLSSWLTHLTTDSKTTHVKIVEVGPRDGLQNETQIPSTQDKIEFIYLLAKAGLSYIEAGSFVSPKWVPSMADSAQVMKGLRWKDDDGDDDYDSEEDRRRRSRLSKVILSCLVPNVKGLELAVEAKADEIAIFASASEAFSQKNINCSIEESMQRFRLVTDAAKELGIPIRGYLSCVLGCPYQGFVSPTVVARVAERLMDVVECHELSLGDTIGVGTPASTVEMLKEVEQVVDPAQLAVHFHDTYGQALVNILVSLERGVRRVDSSVAGLGGCPYAKGASGNVATEDVVYMLNGLGMETGIDIDKLVDAGDFICRALGRTNRSKAGSAISATRLGDTEVNGRASES